MNRSRATLWGLFWMLPLPALAQGPPACDPKEDTVVCELKVERNNAMDELAITGALARRQKEAADKVAAWWEQYVAGVNAQVLWWRNYAEGVAEKEKKHVW